jgi:hypothetical protein
MDGKSWVKFSKVEGYVQKEKENVIRMVSQNKEKIEDD